MYRYEAVRQIESNARTYAASFETVLESGRGIWLRNERGRDILDCLACAGALPLGHNHPEVTEAVLRFLSSGQVQQGLDFTTPAKHAFLTTLFELLPEGLAENAKVQFCGPTGADGVEAAMKLVRYAKGRHGIIAFSGAYHGMTAGAVAAMGNLTPKSGPGPVNAGIHFVPYPYRFRCPFGTDGSDTEALSIRYLENLLADPESGLPKPAAVIVEVVQGEGGCIPASDEWLRELRRVTREHDIALVVDEVQTGFGRTGRLFACQHAGVVPDVLVLSKAVGGGFPLSVVVYDRVLDVWPRGIHAGTFRGNQIAMVAGKATMDILRRDRLDERAAEVGQALREGLQQLARRHPEFGDIRGRGLMLGVEMVQAGPGRPQDGRLATAIKRAAFEHGLLIETGGRHGAVLRFLPPLILGKGDVGQVIDRLDSAVVEAKQGVGKEPCLGR